MSCVLYRRWSSRRGRRTSSTGWNRKDSSYLHSSVSSYSTFFKKRILTLLNSLSLPGDQVISNQLNGAESSDNQTGLLDEANRVNILKDFYLSPTKPITFKSIISTSAHIRCFFFISHHLSSLHAYPCWVNNKVNLTMKESWRNSLC